MNDLSFTSTSTSSAASSTTNSLNRSSLILIEHHQTGVGLKRSKSLCATTTTPHVMHVDDQRLNMQDRSSAAVAPTCYNDSHLLLMTKDILHLRKELETKNAQVDKLNDIRERLESEIRDLTAVLFEQAYEMVNKAKEETMQTTKLLDEAKGKIVVLEAELNALKMLIVNMNANNSTACKQHHSGNNKWQQHKRAVSYSNSFTLPTVLPMLQQQQQQPTLFFVDSSDDAHCEPLERQAFGEIDPILFKEIVLWRENPQFDLNNLFYSRVYREDILPCINFNNQELVQSLMESIKSNNVCIEDISKSHPIETMGVCCLTNTPSICQYKVKFNYNETNWYLISKLCRNRIISVCDFFTYLKYIRDGLVKEANNHEVYWTIMDLRKKMSLSRLGL